MSLLTFYVQMYSVLYFCLEVFDKIIRLLLAIVSINGLNGMKHAHIW